MGFSPPAHSSVMFVMTVYKTFLFPFEKQYTQSYRLQQQRALQAKAAANGGQAHGNGPQLPLTAYAHMSIEEMQRQRIPEPMIREVEAQRSHLQRQAAMHNLKSATPPMPMPHAVPQPNAPQPLQPQMLQPPMQSTTQSQAGPSQLLQQTQPSQQPGMHMQFPGGSQMPQRGLPQQPQNGQIQPPHPVPEQLANGAMMPGVGLRPQLNPNGMSTPQPPTQAQMQEAKTLYQRLLQDFKATLGMLHQYLSDDLIIYIHLLS